MNTEDFLSNYQHNIFQEESSDDPHKTATIKRKCLTQNYVACSQLRDDDLVCDILDENLQELSDLIDDKSNINNYASIVENITSKSHKKSEFQWKNELHLDEYKSLINKIKCCSTIEPSTDDVKRFFSFNTETQNINKCPAANTSTTKKENVGSFKTARDELHSQNSKKYGNSKQQSNNSYGPQKKSLGSSRRGVQNKFIPPTKNNDSQNSDESVYSDQDKEEDPRLKNIEARMIELIRSEIMDSSAPIDWDDIAGLQFAKTIIKEIIVWPLLRPDIFTGLRRPPKGILLFGPPGTGKTLIGKCIASQSGATFFSISASSLTSKWIGDGEKMVRALFAVARCHQPAVIFIDEIDSLLSQRSETEHESSRRIKTEFLVQLDGAGTEEDDRVLIIGATNRPQELDEAARRRFVKRLYIPLPDKSARQQIVERLMKTEKNQLTIEDVDEVAELSGGYSGADMKNLCGEASLGPIRSMDFNTIQHIQIDQVRSITMDDFRAALHRVRASVSSNDLEQYINWDKTYGAGGW